MVAVTAVLIIMCFTVNLANFLSVNSELNQMLDVICKNEGKLPVFPPNGFKNDKPQGQFTKETPYQTRFFVLRFSGDGTLIKADLENIVSVTQTDADKYLKVAYKHGVGYGKSGGYKFKVVKLGNDKYMAIFLDAYQKYRDVGILLTISAASTIICSVLAYAAIVLFSKKATDPVQKASDKQKQFITNAGHELKTPLTVITTSIGVLEMEVGENRWIDKLKSHSEKLKELINTLIALAKMDEGEPLFKFSVFNISDTVCEIVESFIDYAATAGHTINADIQPNVNYCGDEYAIRRLVSILIENAVKYTSPNREINLCLKRSKKGIIISTQNPCDDIDMANLDRLFERFYRGNSSKSPQNPSGFGLGLCIAKTIAETHKGEIHAKTGPENSVIFEVNLV